MPFLRGHEQKDYVYTYVCSVIYPVTGLCYYVSGFPVKASLFCMSISQKRRNTCVADIIVSKPFLYVKQSREV